MSEGLRRAGFEVTGVDIRDLAKHYRGGTFVQADALTFPLDGFDFVHASPPCQAHSSLRHLHPGREYPDLIEPVRERLRAWGGPYSIENVPGAPLGGAYLVVLCGTMFGLQTPDGRAEIRRHRLFELSFCPERQPPRCWHGGEKGDPRQATIFNEAAVEAARRRLGLEPAADILDVLQREVLTVTGTHGLSGKGARERAVITVTGDRCNSSNTPRQALSVTGSGLDSNRERWVRRSLSVTGHAIEISPTNWDGRPVLCRAFLGCRRPAVVLMRGDGEYGYSGTPMPVCQECFDAQATMSVTGAVPQSHTSSDYGKNITRETFSVDDARAAMGIDWMPMKYLSQAIPPVYGQFIGERALAFLRRSKT